VLFFSKYERPRGRKETDAAASDPVATVVGVAMLIVGMAGFAQGGFAGMVGSTGTDLGVFVANPLLSAFHLGVAMVLLRHGQRGPSPLVSSLLVGLAVLETVPVGPRLDELIPVVPGNVAFHLICGLLLGLFVREPKKEGSVR
jgi:hypothetical protein